MHEFDAYTPAEIAARVSAGGVTKARLPLSTLFLLGIMAGGFVGIGALYFTIIVSDSELSFAIARLIGGICFSIGLLLVVVCGAELFTGNILIAMAWADGSIRFTELLRNWGVVCLANFIGAAGFALLVFLSGHWELNGGAVGATYLKIAAALLGKEYAGKYLAGLYGECSPANTKNPPNPKNRNTYVSTRRNILSWAGKDDMACSQLKKKLINLTSSLTNGGMREVNLNHFIKSIHFGLILFMKK